MVETPDTNHNRRGGRQSYSWKTLAEALKYLLEKTRQYAIRAHRLIVFAYTRDASPRSRWYKKMAEKMNIVENAIIHLSNDQNREGRP
jgi:hypothetical protein